MVSKLSETGRCNLGLGHAIHGLEDQWEHLVLNSGSEGKAVQVHEYVCYMFTRSCPGDMACCTLVDSLKSAQKGIWDGTQETVAIVQTVLECLDPNRDEMRMI